MVSGIFGGGGSGGSGSGTTTTTSTQVPWKEAEPHLIDIMNRAKDQFLNDPIRQYQGSSVVQPSNPTMASEDLVIARALAGSPITDSARQEYQNVVDGNYLDVTNNPQFNSITDAIADKYSETVAPQTDAAFSRAGSFGGSAHQNQMAINQRELSRGLNDAAAKLYDTERGRQLTAVFGAPQFAQQDYKELAPLAAVGNQRDLRNQLLIDDAIEKFDFDANKDRVALSEYLDTINRASNGFGTATNQEPYYQNSTAQTLGGIGGLINAGANLYGVISGL